MVCRHIRRLRRLAMLQLEVASPGQASRQPAAGAGDRIPDRRPHPRATCMSSPAGRKRELFLVQRLNRQQNQAHTQPCQHLARRQHRLNLQLRQHLELRLHRRAQLRALSRPRPRRSRLPSRPRAIRRHDLARKLQAPQLPALPPKRASSLRKRTMLQHAEKFTPIRQNSLRRVHARLRGERQPILRRRTRSIQGHPHVLAPGLLTAKLVPPP